MVGFPHSEIPGSKLIRSSPRLIAAYYVLHRLHTPRHPLDALKTLDRSHYQCPQHHQSSALLYANNLRRRIGFLAPNYVWCGIELKVRCVIRKKTKNHVASLFLPEGVGSNGTESDLFTMSKYPALERYCIQTKPNLLSRAHCVPVGRR
jgi:hypothetical protein